MNFWQLETLKSKKSLNDLKNYDKNISCTRFVKNKNKTFIEVLFKNDIPKMRFELNVMKCDE